MPILFLALALLASPSDGAGSDLDRLSGTPGFERAAPPAPASAPDERPAPTPGGAPAQIPVDGGLGLLALAGAGYAVKRLRARRA